MGQVLSRPPTRARWINRGILTHFGLVFFAPVVVQAWVLKSNIQNAPRAYGYNVDVKRLIVYQVLITIILAALSLVAFLHSRAIAGRWRRAFFRINSARYRMPQPSLMGWLRLRKNSADCEERFTAALRGELLESAVVSEADETSVGISVQSVTVSKKLTTADFEKMMNAVTAEGTIAAKKWCAENQATFLCLSRFTAKSNTLRGTAWRADGTWSFKYSCTLSPEAKA
jgi:hypothetical protein